MVETSVTLQGKGQFTKLVTLNKYGKWSTRLFLDQASLEKFRDLREKDGILTHLKKDENNQYYVDLGRPFSKEYKARDGSIKKINFTAPIVLQRDGQTPFVGDIGDGSDLSVELEVYPYTVPGTGKKGKAIRLASVRVDNLVPFVYKTSLSERQLDNLENINKTPPQPMF